VSRRRLSKHDSDSFGSSIYDPLNIGVTKCRAIFVAREFCQHHVGDLVDQLVVVAVLLLSGNPFFSLLVLLLVFVDLCDGFLVTFFADLGRDEGVDNCFDLVERVLP